MGIAALVKDCNELLNLQTFRSTSACSRWIRYFACSKAGIGTQGFETTVACLGPVMLKNYIHANYTFKILDGLCINEFFLEEGHYLNQMGNGQEPEPQNYFIYLAVELTPDQRPEELNFWRSMADS
uniref:Uncharacterized protein n=1 Tax=Tetranychus urticae TaxID=32264 RepID=T1KBZ6_TETUR